MASAPQIRMESSKVHLIASLLTAAISLLQDAVSPPPSAPSEATTTEKPPRTKRPRAVANGKDSEYAEGNGSGGVVVPIGPLLRSPVDPSKEYDLKFAAKYLNISGQTLRKRIDTGAITAEKKGNGRGAWYITGEEIIRFSNSTIGDDQ